MRDEDLAAFVDSAQTFGGRANGSGGNGPRGVPWGHFEFVPIGAANAFEAVDWLIDAHLEAASLAVLYGFSGSLKTFVALHWALCVATGLPFFGCPVRQGPVLYIAAEGRRGLGRRHAAWCSVNGIPLGSGREHVPLFRSTAAGRVTDPLFMARLVALIEAMPVKPVLVVFDTVSKTFGLAKEDNESISAALAILQVELIDRFDCTVLALHHSGKDASRGARGGSSLECDADAMFRTIIETPKNEKDDGKPEPEIEGGTRFDYRRDKVRLTCMKMKDEAPPPDLLFGARLVELGTDAAGKEIGSLALVPGLTPEDQKIIDLLLHGVPVREIAVRTGISRSAISRRKAVYQAMGQLG